jgi:hypothetical protein
MAKTRRTFRLSLEHLEDRVVPAAVSGTPFAWPDVQFVSGAALGQQTAGPSSGATPGGGYSPAQLAQAYGFNQIFFSGVKGDGTGQTIAIIDAYDDPNITSDLTAFDSGLGIAAPPGFTRVDQTGGTSYPAADTGWAQEISLDVEWAHGMAPGANILLVEASSNSLSDLFAAVNYARSQAGVSVVTMSWGSSEFLNESGYDSYFTTPSGHAGVTFIASSGDGGSAGAPQYPAVSPNVIGVGGTNLYLDAANNWSTEVGWSGSGGGLSVYASQPAYQTGVVTQSGTMRTTPDVAYNSGCGMGIYDSYGYGGWVNVGGTSAGAPQWAALVAIADQGRALAGQATLDGPSQALPKLYALPPSDYHDITSGSNGGYSAGPGYDLVTGLGSPYANLIAPALIDSGTGSGPTITTPASATPSPVTGTTTNLSVAATDPAGAATLTYTWSVLSEPSGAKTPSFSANGTNAAQNDTATFYLAGSYTFQVTVKDGAGLTATSSVTVVVNQTFTSVGVAPSTASVPEGKSQQFTATTLDQFGQAMSSQPAGSSFSWSLGSGSVGSVSTSGLYSAPSATTGAATVIATYTLSGSASVTVTPSVTVPLAPTNLTATGGSKVVNLAWSESSTNVTGFNIQRSQNGGKGWTQIATVTTTKYSDTTVKSGTSYVYRVDASNSAGSSAWTKTSSVTPHDILIPRGAAADGSGPSSANVPALTPSAPTLPQSPSDAVFASFVSPTAAADHVVPTTPPSNGPASQSVTSAQQPGGFVADTVSLATLPAVGLAEQPGGSGDAADSTGAFAWADLLQL